MGPVLGFIKLVRRSLLLGNGWIKLRCRNLFGGGVNEAKLACAEVFLGGTHGRPKRAAEDGPMLIQIAGAAYRIEHRTRLVVGELLEQDDRFIVLGKYARIAIAGKPRVYAGDRLPNAGTNPQRSFRVSNPEKP